MNTLKFLQTILPDDGEVCIAGIGPKGIRYKFTETFDEVEQLIAEFADKQYNVYFACSTYNDQKRRKAENAVAMRSLWLDIDCGEEKPYANHDEALNALYTFAKEFRLPKPYIVNSGNGIHAYWPFDHNISPEEWSPVAEHLRIACLEHGLAIDPVVTQDAARILRVPGTFNFKNRNNPLPVEVMLKGKTSSFEVLREIVKAIPVAKVPVTKRKRGELSALTKALMGNVSCKFRRIVQRCAGGTGCGQIMHMLENPEEVDEPHWRAGLSIAAHCDDAEKAIHFLSKGHPDYDFEETEKKANLTGGPYRCETFQRNWPAHCEGCKHKITTPITLGQKVEETTKTVDEIVAEHKEQTDRIVKEEDTEMGRKSVDIPLPFFRAEGGGIYKNVPSPDGDGEVAELVYINDLLVKKRVMDDTDGESVIVTVHLPRDGTREVLIPLKNVMAPEKLRDSMCSIGVLGSQKTYLKIMEYITSVVMNMQHKYRSDTARNQFGWVDGCSGFVLGDREYRQTGAPVENSPASSTKSIMPYFSRKGTVDKHAEIIGLYNQPGLENYSFAAATGFGAPLLRFYSNISGAIIHLISPESGTGKSTLERVVNSIWGDPDGLMLVDADTMLSKIHRIGVMNNLPITIDEITNMAPEDASNLAYIITQGRGRNRMNSGTNTERVNHTTWRTLGLTSGNSRLSDKIVSKKATADGELARILEININGADIANAQYMFDQLEHNHGEIGHGYAQFLVHNVPRITAAIDKMRDNITDLIGFNRAERFWLASCACNLVGASFANELVGREIFNIERLIRFCAKLIEASRRRSEALAKVDSSALAEYIGAHFSEILRVRSNSSVLDLEANMPQRIVGRYEKDVKKLSLSVPELNKFLYSRQISMPELMRALANEGIFATEGRRSMTQGTAVPTPPIRVLIVNCDKGAAANWFLEHVEDHAPVVPLAMPEDAEGEDVLGPNGVRP